MSSLILENSLEDLQAKRKHVIELLHSSSDPFFMYGYHKQLEDIDGKIKLIMEPVKSVGAYQNVIKITFSSTFKRRGRSYKKFKNEIDRAGQFVRDYADANKDASEGKNKIIILRMLMITSRGHWYQYRGTNKNKSTWHHSKYKGSPQYYINQKNLPF